MPEFRLRISETGRWPASAEAIFKILHNTGLAGVYCQLQIRSPHLRITY